MFAYLIACYSTWTTKHDSIIQYLHMNLNLLNSDFFFLSLLTDITSEHRRLQGVLQRWSGEIRLELNGGAEEAFPDLVKSDELSLSLEFFNFFRFKKFSEYTFFLINSHWFCQPYACCDSTGARVSSSPARSGCVCWSLYLNKKSSS